MIHRKSSIFNFTLNTWILRIIIGSGVLLLFNCNRPEPVTSDVVHPKLLTVEFVDNPVGVDTSIPHFSWKLFSKQRNQFQTAYQIIVSSDLDKLQEDNGDIWNSEKVKSDLSVSVPYQGKELNSATQYFWKVKVWDKNGKESAWSVPSMWITGILKKNDWKAQWIGIERKEKEKSIPALYLRRDFNLDKKIKSAIAFFSCTNNSEFYINGYTISNQVFPQMVKITNTAEYFSVDVTNLIKKGKNTLAAVVSRPNGMIYKTHPDFSKISGILMQVEIECTDGSKIQVLSNEKWKYSINGPVNFSEKGITYEAANEMPGWNSSKFDSDNWATARILSVPHLRLVSKMYAPFKADISLKAKAISQQKNAWLFDFGSVKTGWIKFNPHYGKTNNVSFHYSEILKPDGSWADSSSIDQYKLNSDEDPINETSLLIRNFRYLFVEGLTINPDSLTIELKSFGLNLPVDGEFDCSNEKINDLYRQSFLDLQKFNLDLADKFTKSGSSNFQICQSSPYVFNISALLKTWLNQVSQPNTDTFIVADSSFSNNFFEILNKFYSNSGPEKNPALYLSFMKDEGIELNFDDSTKTSNASCKLTEWLYSNLSGIKTNPETGGFKHFFLKPVIVKNVEYINATYNSTVGPVISNWRIFQDSLIWRISIPVNSTAGVLIPSISDRVHFEGKNVINEVRFITLAKEYCYFEMGSGDYTIKSRLLITR